jgi:hypothetical protein
LSDSNQSALVKSFAHPCNPEQRKNVKYGARNGEKIGVKLPKINFLAKKVE